MISLNQNMFYMKMFFNEDNSFGFEKNDDCLIKRTALKI